MPRVPLLLARARGRVRVGGRTDVAPGVRISVARAARVLLGDGASLGEGVVIEALAGEVVVGARAVVQQRTVIRCRAGITIGEGAVIGAWASLDDSAPSTDDVERPVREQPVRSMPIEIGAGARIGLHAAVGAGAVVPAGATLDPYAVAEKV